MAPSKPTTPPKSPKSKGKQRASPSSSHSPSSPSASAASSPAVRRIKQSQPATVILEEPPAVPTLQEEQGEDSNEMLTLAERIADAAHLLVRGRGSEDLAEQARQVVKRSFDSALASEPIAFPQLATLLASFAPSSGVSTRSSSAAAAAAEPAASSSSFVLAPTPISELTVDGGLDAEMIWEQMELRGKTVEALMDEMFGQTDMDGEEEGEGGEFDDEDEGEYGGAGSEEEESQEEEEDDGEEPPTPEEEEYFRRLAGGLEEEEPSEDEEEDDEEDDEEEEDEDEAPKKKQKKDKVAPDADGNRDLTLDNFDGENGKKRARARRASGPASSVDDTFFSLHDFHVDADEGEFEMEKMLKGENLSDDDMDENMGEDGEGGLDLFAAVGGMGGDDDDEDEDEEEEGDLDIGGLMYKDFFDPPARAPSRPKKGVPPKKSSSAAKLSTATLSAPSADAATTPSTAGAPKKRGVRFSESVKVKEIPHRLADKRAKAAAGEVDDEEEDDFEGAELEEALASAGLEGMGSDDEMEMEDDDLATFGGEDEEMGEFGEEEEGSEDEEDDEEEEIQEGQEVIERFKTSLFDDEEEEKGDKNKNLSRHERRLLQLASQISALEQENVGKKHWATTGEAQSRDREKDSLLEEDLDFERMGKVAPQVTEEQTQGIEALIKKRILDNQFDDVERRRPLDPNALLPSRYMELQDSQSKKSLAEVYEDEFRDARDREAGNEVVNELDKDLQKKHEEIEGLFEDLAARLDALSNARFTPKAPKATITTVSNLPSISLESALPTTNSTSTLMAPEEVYTPHRLDSALAVSKEDQTPQQKKAARQKAREHRKVAHEKTERILASQVKRKGVRGEKEQAEKVLLGTKGVTVLGKNGKEKRGEKRKRGEGGVGEQTGVNLKL